MALQLTVPQDFRTVDGTSLAERLRQHLDVGRPNYRIYKAVEPISVPALIELIGNAAAWLPLSAAATVFLTTIAKRAADATWDAVAARLKRHNAESLIDTTTALADAAKRGGPETAVVVGLDIPDPNWGTALMIDNQDPLAIARALATFVANIERIDSLMNAEVAAGRAPLGRAHISVSGDELVIRWIGQDRARHERRLALTNDNSSETV